MAGKMFNEYQVTLKFKNELMGGIPKNPEVIKSWLEARAPKVKLEGAAGLQVLTEEVVSTIQEEEEKMWCGFKQDEKGIFVENRQIKAHMKDCANQLQKFLDVKALRSKLANRVFIEPERIYTGKDKPDGFYEHPVHVMVKQGPRSALKRNDYLLDVTVKFVLKILDDNIITRSILERIFEYGGEHGAFAERGLCFGRYEATIED